MNLVWSLPTQDSKLLDEYYNGTFYWTVESVELEVPQIKLLLECEVLGHEYDKKGY